MNGNPKDYWRSFTICKFPWTSKINDHPASGLPRKTKLQSSMYIKQQEEMTVGGYGEKTTGAEINIGGLKHLALVVIIHFVPLWSLSRFLTTAPNHWVLHDSVTRWWVIRILQQIVWAVTLLLKYKIKINKNPVEPTLGLLLPKRDSSRKGITTHGIFKVNQNPIRKIISLKK